MWTGRKRRGSRARERNLRKASRARRPAPQPAFPARAECSLWAPRRRGERARAGPGGARLRGGMGGLLRVGLCDPRGRAPSCLPLKSKRRRSGRRARGGENMVRRFSITVRIRARGGPPRVTVHIARPAGEWAAPGVCWLPWPSC